MADFDSGRTCAAIKAQETEPQSGESFTPISAFSGQQVVRKPRERVNADQEVWIKQQVLTAIRTARAVERACRVRADQPILDCAIDGIANGAAVEIIHTLDMEPEYTNLRKYLPGVLE